MADHPSGRARRVIDAGELPFAVAFVPVESGGHGLLRRGDQPRGRRAVGHRRAGGLGGVAALGWGEVAGLFCGALAAHAGSGGGRSTDPRAGFPDANRFPRRVCRADLAAGAHRRVRNDRPFGGRDVRMAPDVGHDQRRGHRQLRCPESYLCLRFPTAGALSFLCDRGRPDWLAGLVRGGEFRRVGHLAGCLGSQLGAEGREFRS